MSDEDGDTSHGTAMPFSSTRTLQVTDSARIRLNRLGACAWGLCVVYGDLDSFTAEQSPAAFGGHQGAHLASNFGGDFAVGQRFFNRGGEVALGVEFLPAAVSDSPLEVRRLNPGDGVDLILRRIGTLNGLQASAFLEDRFSVGRSRCVAHRLESLHIGCDPAQADELGGAFESHGFPAALGGAVHHGFDRGQAFAGGAEAEPVVGEGDPACLIAKVIRPFDQPGAVDIESLVERRH